jgi:hypothetical protein
MLLLEEFSQRCIFYPRRSLEIVRWIDGSMIDALSVSDGHDKNE